MEDKVQRDVTIEILGERFTLLPENAVFWHREQALLFSDVHLGKAEVFQRQGIPVPLGADDANILRLENLCATFDVRKLYCLGDFIHSKLFWSTPISRRVSSFMNHWGPNFVLIAGNHEMGTAKNFAVYGTRIEEEQMLLRGFLLSHHDDDDGSHGWNGGGGVSSRDVTARGARGGDGVSDGRDGGTIDAVTHGSAKGLATPGREKNKSRSSSAKKIASEKPFTISGHVHPVIRIGGHADNITTRCFYLTKNALLLPAFGEFTGGYKIKPKGDDRVFAVLPDSVVEI